MNAARYHSAEDVYLVRANGKTVHNDPLRAGCYVKGSVVDASGEDFDFSDFCARAGFARIGWPDVGDLGQPPQRRVGARADCYDLNSLRRDEPGVADDLLSFAAVAVGSAIVMPHKASASLAYVGRVTAPYHYRPGPPEPYECAHRLGVAWLSRGESAQRFAASRLGLSTRGGFWRWRFAKLTGESAEAVRSVLAAGG